MLGPPRGDPPTITVTVEPVGRRDPGSGVSPPMTYESATDSEGSRVCGVYERDGRLIIEYARKDAGLLHGNGVVENLADTATDEELGRAASDALSSYETSLEPNEAWAAMTQRQKMQDVMKTASVRSIRRFHVGALFVTVAASDPI